MWFFFLLVYMTFFVTQSLWQRTYSQKSTLPDTFPPAISYAIGVLPLGIIVGLCMSHHVVWTSWLLLLLIVEGAFIGLFNWLMFIAYEQLSVAKFEMIFQLYVVVVVVLGWTLLGEKLTLVQCIGGALLFVAAYIAISAPKDTEPDGHKRANRKAMLITACAAIALGIGLVTEKAALKHMDLGAYFIFGFATQTIALLIIATKDVSRRTLSSISQLDVKRSLIMGVQSALLGLAYLAALKLSNNISLITVLTSFTLPLIVLAGYLFLHERENMARMWLSATLGCVGLIIVAL